MTKNTANSTILPSAGLIQASCYLAKSVPVGLVVSRFNENITKDLLEGAMDSLARLGVAPEDQTVVWVPGAYEIPYALQQLGLSGRFKGLLALGCLVKGETAHFDYIANEVSKSITQIMLNCQLPIGFGLLTTYDVQQAQDRVGGKAGHKGREAAQALVEMINLGHQFSSTGLTVQK